MTSMPQTEMTPNLPVAVSSPVVLGGIEVLGTHSFSTTRAGYRALIRWLRSFGDVRRVGVEGTGSYGAGIARYLVDAGIEVVEVDRPDRSERRRKGKDDDLDAIGAARAALHNRRTSTPKSKDGPVESLRVLRVTRATAIRARRNALQLLRMTIVAASPFAPHPKQCHHSRPGSTHRLGFGSSWNGHETLLSSVNGSETKSRSGALLGSRSSRKASSSSASSPVASSSTFVAVMTMVRASSR